MKHLDAWRRALTRYDARYPGRLARIFTHLWVGALGGVLGTFLVLALTGGL